MSMSAYCENKVLDALHRGQALGAPTTLYMALFTTQPTGNGSNGAGGVGTGNVEVTASNGYARVSLGASGLTIFKSTQNDSLASTGNTGVSSNTNVITFPTSTGAWSAGAAIVGFGLYDALTVGNLWEFGTCTPNTLTVAGTGVTISFAAGTLTITAT
jgi:hypothetical protein